jgi:hypothetical protein
MLPRFFADVLSPGARYVFVFEWQVIVLTLNK